jgi:hypothetical protein
MGRLFAPTFPVAFLCSSQAARVVVQAVRRTVALAVLARGAAAVAAAVLVRLEV